MDALADVSEIIGRFCTEKECRNLSLVSKQFRYVFMSKKSHEWEMASNGNVSSLAQWDQKFDSLLRRKPKLKNLSIYASSQDQVPWGSFPNLADVMNKHRHIRYTFDILDCPSAIAGIAAAIFTCPCIVKHLRIDVIIHYTCFCHRMECHHMGMLASSLKIAAKESDPDSGFGSNVKFTLVFKERTDGNNSTHNLPLRTLCAKASEVAMRTFVHTVEFTYNPNRNVHPPGMKNLSNVSNVIVKLASPLDPINDDNNGNNGNNDDNGDNNNNDIKDVCYNMHVLYTSLNLGSRYIVEPDVV